MASYLPTVESLELMAAQFSWYSWVVLRHEFTFSTKTDFEIVFLPFTVFYFTQVLNFMIPLLSIKL